MLPLPPVSGMTIARHSPRPVAAGTVNGCPERCTASVAVNAGTFGKGCEVSYGSSRTPVTAPVGPRKAT